MFNGYGENLHGHNIAVKVAVWTDAGGDMLRKDGFDSGDYLSSKKRSSDGYVKLVLIAGGCCSPAAKLAVNSDHVV